MPVHQLLQKKGSRCIVDVCQLFLCMHFTSLVHASLCCYIMDTRARNGLETPMQLPYNLCFRFATSVFPPFFLSYPAKKSYKIL